MGEVGAVALVLVDFDDTLVDTAPRFQNARRALFALLEELGFDAEQARRLHHDVIDPVMLDRHGLGPARLRHSFRATYEELCLAMQLEPVAEIIARCEQIGADVVGAPPLFTGALDALGRLAARHRTVLFTQARDHEYQRSCVRAVGVLDVLAEQQVHICERKTVDAFRGVLEAFGRPDPATVWMVGNSMRSDINPALEIGARAILIDVADPWEHDAAEPYSAEFMRAASFIEAVDYLLALE